MKILLRLRRKVLSIIQIQIAKITKFAKKQMIRLGVLKALKLGFTVILVDPNGTNNSINHRQIMEEKGLDKHIASAYIIAYKGLRKNQRVGTLNEIINIKSQFFVKVIKSLEDL